MMMKSIKIELKLLEDIKSFVQCVNQYGLAINLHAGRAYVNAKSILGIFSLDISRPINVEVDENDSNIGKVQMLLKDLRKYRLQ